MRTLIIGATGTIGRRVLLHRLSMGDAVTVMTRNAQRTRRLLGAMGHVGVPTIEGDTSAPGPWQAAVDGQDVVIVLGGAGIADKRWSKRRMKEIRTSRIDGVYQVVRAIDNASQPPSVLVVASAVGYYGDTGRVLVDEFTPAGGDELAGLCMDWENQAIRAERLCRVIRLRLGVVLDASGGALRKMLPVFKRGLGGRLGSGRQYMSWIAWHDVVGIIDHLLKIDSASGAYNLASPTSVTNSEFTRTLANVLGRRAFLPVPGPALRLAVGKLARFLLMGQRAYPARVLEAGYEFKYPVLEGALQAVLNSTTGDEPSTEDAGPSESPGIIVVDLDGFDGPSSDLGSALRLLDRTGCDLILATSRGVKDTVQLLHDLDRSSTTIAADGALILGRGGTSVHSSRPLGDMLLFTILSALGELNELIEVEFERQDGMHSSWNSSQPPPPVESLSGIHRIHVGGNEAACARAEHLIRERFWKQRQVACQLEEDGRLAVLDPLADRGIAIQEIARRLHVPRERVAAVVNADRSAGLAEWCGFSVALKGASATIQGLADATTRSPGTDGIVEAMERWLRPRPTAPEKK